MSVPRISPQQVMACLERSEPVVLLDVRTSAEFEAVHVDGARLIPLHELTPEQITQQLDGHAGRRPVHVLCWAGKRAVMAAERLKQAGLQEVYVVEGGMQAWEAAGLPVVRGRRTISLERQVRIAAGSLVLLGVVLGWVVHPLLYLIAAFVGGGLVFAGVTDTCGMALLLARMPWNRGGGCGDGRTCAA